MKISLLCSLSIFKDAGNYLINHLVDSTLSDYRKLYSFIVLCSTLNFFLTYSYKHRPSISNLGASGLIGYDDYAISIQANDKKN